MLDLSSINELNKEEALKVQAKLLGYRVLPVSMDEFLDNDYYLGTMFKGNKIYPYWREVLKDIFPTPIHIRYPYVIFTGAIGTGKSVCSKIISLYNLYKLDCLDNEDYFGIVRTKPYSFIYGAKSAFMAQTDLINSINDIYSKSPYFNSDFNWDSSKYAQVSTGIRSNTEVGKEAIFYHWNEINFWNNYYAAKEKIDQSMDRYRSRFLRVEGYFGGIVIDSSSAGDESIVDYIIKEYPQFNVYRTAIWEAKKHQGIYFRNGTFDVYSGDSVREPFIITEEEPLTKECDPDRVLKVPNELYENYKNNIELALQNTAGISTTSTDIFFTEKEKVKQAYSINNYIPDVIQVDFYDNEQYWDLIKEQILRIPKGKIIFLHLDLGISGDLAGLAAAYFDEWIYDENGDVTSDYSVKVPFVVGISRPKGQETPVNKIYNLIKKINEHREIGSFTTDQFQSTQIRQDISRLGITTYLQSVDRSTDPYIFLKQLIYKELCSIAKNKRCKVEMLNLINTGYKVDHKSDGSKDISDAVCGAVYGVRNNLDYAQQISLRYTEQQQTELLDMFNISSGINLELMNRNRSKF